MSATRKITVGSSDGGIFEVDEAVVVQSQTMMDMMDDDSADNVLSLPNVTSKVLSKVIDYCKKHVAGADEDDLKNFDSDFVKVDQPTLWELILAADNLKIKSLVDLTCRTAADMIKAKTPEEIYRAFALESDFTPEEEEEVRRENPWAFERRRI